MSTMLQIIRQEENEKRFNRKHVDGYIRESIANNPVVTAQLNHGITLVNEYIAKTYSYASKNIRVAQLVDLDIEALVTDIFVGIAYCLKEEVFTSVTAKMASRLKFSDKLDAIKTVAEILAVLCITDAFDISKASRGSSLVIVSRIPLEDSVLTFIHESQYLPPMVCEPLALETNFSSGYLTHSDSLILGKQNHHDGDICLDVLNTINAVALRLDTDFISQVEEDPNKEFTLDTVKASALKKGQVLTEGEAQQQLAAQVTHWRSFKAQSYEMYLLLATQGNRIFLTNKVDKRGRIYNTGYHVNLQGQAHKKAMVELYNEELIEGMPSI